MSTPTIAAPAQTMPAITVQTLDGGEANLGGPGWKAVFVYRGAHCPLCKEYLAQIEERAEKFAELGLEVIAVSVDSADRARPFIEESGYTGTVGVGLTLDQARQLGLYVSQPRSEQEAPAPFAEPGVFIVNAEGTIQILDKSNAPFARPDLDSLLGGVDFIQKNNYPIRGALAA